MKRETIERILSGEKKTLNVMGHIYEIELRTNVVTLIPAGYGEIEAADIAHSEVRYDQYEYTHGGVGYRRAVEAAKEIRKAMIDKRAKESDV